MQQGIGQAIRAGAFIYIAVYENWVTLPRPLEGKQTPTSTPTPDQFQYKPPEELSRPTSAPYFSQNLYEKFDSRLSRIYTRSSILESEFIREVWFSLSMVYLSQNLNVL